MNSPAKIESVPAFVMDADYLPFHPNPSKPVFAVPRGAVDAHCHVFGPGATFPYARTRKYTPCDASRGKLFELRDFLGFERNVIVQATCHGNDNRALVDALVHSGGRARGVVSVGRDVTDAELRALHAGGVRGTRFNFVRRLVDFTPRDVLTEIAHRIAPLGWHVVVYFEAQDLPELWDFFTSLPTTVVVDHMGRPDVGKPVHGPEFKRFIRLLSDHPNIWTKVSCPERLSKSGPSGYDDVVPFAKYLVDTFPDRVLWGTDWPHPNMKTHMPDDGKLVDFVPRIATTPELQRRLLVDNPMRLYWSDTQ
jgi:2-pyrone-4,6-dicarboxylate lactonase